MEISHSYLRLSVHTVGKHNTGGRLSDNYRSSQVLKREEGETQERYNAQLRFLMKISDWSDPEYLDALRDAMLPEPVAEPDRAGGAGTVDTSGEA